jgi:alkanesulfonate monooxygenase SsuD/methylene tetrahydromethanopterin reductase-like flavin-dependent oxidoreductase (luciferase family)
MSGRLRLGVLTRVYRPDRSPDALHETLALFEAAEALGFDSAWVAQHHFGTESGRLPSPLVLLAAAAQRTRRIRLGTGVIVLPLEHPLRLAEDAVVLDALSDGRLELGLGAGFDPRVFEAFGQDIEQRHAQQAASMRALQCALSGELLTVQGATLQPPGSALRQRLWQATSYAQSAAENGNGLIIARTRAGQLTEADLAARYRQSWSHAHPYRIALVRAIVPGEDPVAVRTAIGPDIRRYIERMATLTGTATPVETDLGAALAQLGVLHGTPDQIVEALQNDAALPYATDLIVQVQTESTSLDDAIRRLEYVATAVAPALDASALHR